MSYRPQVTNRSGFAKHAAPEAIAAHLTDATKAQIEATREVAWLSRLLEERRQQVAAGQWPPPARTEVLSVRFTDDEIAAVDGYATARGLSRSDALRHMITKLLAEGGSQP